MQGGSPIEVALLDQPQHPDLAGAALGEAPGTELADRPHQVGNAGVAGLTHGPGGGKREDRMHVEQVVVVEMAFQPPHQIGAEGELPQGVNGGTPARKGNQGNALAVDPLPGGQGGIQTWTMVIGGEDRGVDAPLAEGPHHVQHRLARSTPQRADRGDHMENSKARLHRSAGAGDRPITRITPARIPAAAASTVNAASTNCWPASPMRRLASGSCAMRTRQAASAPELPQG